MVVVYPSFEVFISRIVPHVVCVDVLLYSGVKSRFVYQLCGPVIFRGTEIDACKPKVCTK